MNKFKNIWLALPVIAGVAAVGYGAWVYTNKSSNEEYAQAADAQGADYATAEAGFDTEEDAQAWAGAAPEQTEPASGLTLQGPSSTPQAAPAQQAAPKANLNVVVDGIAPTAARTLGRSDAPVTIIDFSSLTCPHCASAHENVLPRLIEDYVNTGKVRIIFNDFPLNQPALDASKISRCVANDQYFGFMSMLFGSIEQWAYSNNHPEGLINNAVLTGLSPEKARECLNDKAVEEAILKGLQEGAQKYQVNSTPTFIVNDGAHTIRGAQAYTVFQRAIEAELEKANNQ